MRLIDADTLIEKLELAKEEKTNRQFEDGFNAALMFAQILAKVQPTVDERKHGHWIRVSEADSDGNADFYCSVCLFVSKQADGMEIPYCWHCGAVMDEVEK